MRASDSPLLMEEGWGRRRPGHERGGGLSHADRNRRRRPAPPGHVIAAFLKRMGRSAARRRKSRSIPPRSGDPLWLAQAFWVSGVLRLANWDTALTLATHEYPVPWLDPFTAAVLGITIEVLGSMLLAFGLCHPAGCDSAVDLDAGDPVREYRALINISTGPRCSAGTSSWGGADFLDRQLTRFGVFGIAVGQTAGPVVRFC